MKLTNEEYNLLQKISSNSKMDCWFDLRQTKVGEDIVYDLENNKRMSLKQGISQLLEGIEGIEKDYLDFDSAIILINLLRKLLD